MKLHMFSCIQVPYVIFSINTNCLFFIILECGRTYQENSAIFTSPYYHPSSPAPMEPEKCEWRITATHGERIVLNITDIDIFPSDNCETDYIEIRDGYWIESPVLGN